MNFNLKLTALLAMATILNHSLAVGGPGGVVHRSQAQKTAQVYSSLRYSPKQLLEFALQDASQADRAYASQMLNEMKGEALPEISLDSKFMTIKSKKDTVKLEIQNLSEATFFLNGSLLKFHNNGSLQKRAQDLQKAMAAKRSMLLNLILPQAEASTLLAGLILLFGAIAWYSLYIRGWDGLAPAMAAAPVCSGFYDLIHGTKSYDDDAVFESQADALKGLKVVNDMISDRVQKYKSKCLPSVQNAMCAAYRAVFGCASEYAPVLLPKLKNPEAVKSLKLNTDTHAQYDELVTQLEANFKAVQGLSSSGSMAPGVNAAGSAK
jgi:hypothetical protein